MIRGLDDGFQCVVQCLGQSPHFLPGLRAPAAVPSPGCRSYITPVYVTDRPPRVRHPSGLTRAAT